MIRRLSGVVIILLVQILTGCGIPHGESIEDCRTMGQCYYYDKSVHSEGSDMSNELKELLHEEEDDIVFFYSRNPGGEYFDLEYHSSDVFSLDSMDEIILVLINARDIVHSYYTFDETNLHMKYGNTVLSLYLNSDDTVTYLSAIVDNSTYKNMDDYTETEIITHLNATIDIVKILLEYPSTGWITWYGIGDIVLVIEDNVIDLLVNRQGDTTGLTQKIEILLETYDIDITE